MQPSLEHSRLHCLPLNFFRIPLGVQTTSPFLYFCWAAVRGVRARAAGAAPRFLPPHVLLTTLLKPSGQSQLSRALIGRTPGHAPLAFSPALLRDPRSNRQGAESETTPETEREGGVGPPPEVA